MVATPRCVKMLPGSEPVAEPIPMMTGKGPAPVGRLIDERKVIVAPACVTVTVSMLPEKVAVTLLGGAPLGPDTQYCICELISARRHLHSALVLMRAPLVIRGS